MNELAPRIHDDSNGLDYILVGDYYIPALALDMPDIPTIGRWGRMRLEFIRKNCPSLYHELKRSGKLQGYLREQQQQVMERLDRIISQLQTAENVTERLKADNQWEWVCEMNSIRSRAEEIVINELIYER